MVLLEFNNYTKIVPTIIPYGRRIESIKLRMDDVQIKEANVYP